MFPRPALIAVQFLTRFPVCLTPAPAGREVGLALLWYPVIGLLLGALLWVAALLLSAVPPPLAAAIVLVVWVSCTGALHLDGLADTADAWVGGRGDRERTLAIMKDPSSGPVGIAAVVCVLLLKFAALSALRDVADPHSTGGLHLACGCILPPVLARAAVPFLLAQTPYVRAQGIGAEIAQYQSRPAGRWVTALTGVLVILVCRFDGVLALGGAGVVYLLMRRAFVRRVGGVTGDCAGAMIEVIEAVSLVAVTVSMP